MCSSFPCRPLPEEAIRLMKEGYGSRLMLDRETGVVMPALRGLEGHEFTGLNHRQLSCTFLTDKQRCELHDLGLKPFEGRMCRHDTPHENDEAYYEVLSKWGTTIGRTAVKAWKRTDMKS